MDHHAAIEPNQKRAGGWLFGSTDEERVRPTSEKGLLATAETARQFLQLQDERCVRFRRPRLRRARAAPHSPNAAVQLQCALPFCFSTVQKSAHEAGFDTLALALTCSLLRAGVWTRSRPCYLDSSSTSICLAVSLKCGFADFLAASPTRLIRWQLAFDPGQVRAPWTSSCCANARPFRASNQGIVVSPRTRGGPKLVQVQQICSVPGVSKSPGLTQEATTWPRGVCLVDNAIHTATHVARGGTGHDASAIGCVDRFGWRVTPAGELAR